MKLKVNTGTPSSPQWTAVDAENADTLNSKSASTIVSEAVTKANTSVGTLSNLKTTNKSNIVSAMNELFTSASDGKTAISSAITRKGVTSTTADTFASMASKIDSIPEGYASGTKLALGTDFKKVEATLKTSDINAKLFERHTYCPTIESFLTYYAYYGTYTTSMYDKDFTNLLFSYSVQSSSQCVFSKTGVSHLFVGTKMTTYDERGNYLKELVLPFNSSSRIIEVGNNGYFYAANPSSNTITKYDDSFGEILTVTLTSDPTTIQKMIIDDNGNIFVSSKTTSTNYPVLFALDSNLNTKWSKRFIATNISSSFPLTLSRLASDKTMVYASNDYYIEAHSISDGTRKWRINLTDIYGFKINHMCTEKPGFLIVSNLYSNPFPSEYDLSYAGFFMLDSATGKVSYNSGHQLGDIVYIDDDHFFGVEGNHNGPRQIQKLKYTPEYYTVI